MVYINILEKVEMYSSVTSICVEFKLQTIIPLAKGSDKYKKWSFVYNVLFACSLCNQINSWVNELFHRNCKFISVNVFLLKSMSLYMLHDKLWCNMIYTLKTQFILKFGSRKIQLWTCDMFRGHDFYLEFRNWRNLLVSLSKKFAMSN